MEMTFLLLSLVLFLTVVAIAKWVFGREHDQFSVSLVHRQSMSSMASSSSNPNPSSSKEEWLYGWTMSTNCSRYHKKIREINLSIKIELDATYSNNRLETHQLLEKIGKGVNHNKLKTKYKYDVLLSFSGETRMSFTDQLYTALKRSGITVFKDNWIRKGEQIPSTLMQAIESTRISIIIFSVNYGSSSWCLHELEKIMECYKTIGQKVLPIFYGVRPSDVRNQRGDFGNELKKLMRKIKANKNRKSNWKRALNEVANLCGWDLHQYRTDAELIDSVIQTVKAELPGNRLETVFAGLHGIRNLLGRIFLLLMFNVCVCFCFLYFYFEQL